MAGSNNWHSQVLEDVRAASIKPPMTKAEAVAYFQDRFTGRGADGWKQNLVRMLASITGMKPKNLEKRFDPQRLHNPEPRNSAQYKTLGAIIGYKPPKYGYHVHFEGWVFFSGACTQRTIDADVTGKWAEQVAAEPRLVLPAMFLIYMEEDDQDRDVDEQEPSVGFCEEGDETEFPGVRADDPDIGISANQKEKHSGHGGRARRFSFFDR